MLPLWLQHRAVCINNTQKPPERETLRKEVVSLKLL